MAGHNNWMNWSSGDRTKELGAQGASVQDDMSDD